jgi:hypothetical protein
MVMVFSEQGLESVTVGRALPRAGSSSMGISIAPDDRATPRAVKSPFG